MIDASEALIGNPYVTARHLAQATSMARQYVIATLERGRSALYVARDALEVLQRD